MASFLILSGHDYRSRRKASIHFIAENLAGRGEVRFYSVGFSALSRFKSDPRSNLHNSTNRSDLQGGVECYLEGRAIHPGNYIAGIGRRMNDLLFRYYVETPSNTLINWIDKSDVIIIESGLAIVYFDLIKARNPNAKVIYTASDRLETIGCADFIRDALMRAAPRLDGIRVPSTQMVEDFPALANVFVVRHGMEPLQPLPDEDSPYPVGSRNAVSVGSMLFDAGFFEIAGPRFPDVTFHLIGSGVSTKRLSAPNIRVYSEMRYLDTHRYILNADFGIAAYRADSVDAYLADTSLKLMQYGAAGLPAVAPELACGGIAARFGFEPGNEESIVSAVAAALNAGRLEAQEFASWSKVVEDILAHSGCK